MKRALRMAVLLAPISLLVLWPNGRGLQAQGGAHSITLSWTATAGTAPTGYNVKRGTAAGAEVTIGTTTAPVTTFVDSSGVGGTTYFYVVTATNPAASPSESVPSNEVSGTFLPLGPLGAPSGLAAVSK